MSTIAFYTLGCKVNQSDTASMEKLFVQNGYKVVDFTETADVYLINTCVVTNMGQSKSRKIIHRAARKSGNPLIVVTGCYPQTSPEEVAKIAGVDLLVGNQDRKNIVELVNEALNNHPEKAINQVHAFESGFENLAAGVEATKDRAFLKIQEGCNQYCSYCIIPYARGPLRSRSLESIRKEVAGLVQDGFQEVVLIGIHLGAYGHETEKAPHLDKAVEAALSVPGLKRLRLGSLESVEVDEHLLEIMTQDTRLCPHLHLPLQAGCDKTLKNMHRPYTTAKFKQLLNDIRAKVPGIAITTDVIVGFPGETPEDFAATKKFAEECNFSKIHVFPFSRRQGTPAATMAEQVPENEKQARAAELGALDNELHKAYCQSLVGNTYEVLWEMRNKEGFWEGLTPNYVRTFCQSSENLTGKILPIKIEKTFLDGVLGDIIQFTRQGGENND